MRLKLKEEPREWRKFAAVAAVFATGVAYLAHRRGWLPWAGFVGAAGVVSCLLGVGLVWPRLVRPVYRGAMTASHWMGQRVGVVLLAGFFVLVLTPVALVVRWLGKDLLDIRGSPEARPSFWRPPRPEGSLDRLF